MFGFEELPDTESIIEYQESITPKLYSIKDEISNLVNDICFKLKFINKYDTFVMVHTNLLDKEIIDKTLEPFIIKGYNISYHINFKIKISTVFIKWANIFHT